MTNKEKANNLANLFLKVGIYMRDNGRDSVGIGELDPDEPLCMRWWYVCNDLPDMAAPDPMDMMYIKDSELDLLRRFMVKTKVTSLSKGEVENFRHHYFELWQSAED